MTLPVPQKPHVTKVAGGVANVMGSHETMAVGGPDGRLYVQEGAIYDEAGLWLDPETVPEWFWDEWKKVTPAMKARHGDPQKKGPEKATVEGEFGKGQPIGEIGKDDPGQKLAKRVGDVAGRSGDPEHFEPEQLSPELRDALNIPDESLPASLGGEDDLDADEETKAKRATHKKGK